MMESGEDGAKTSSQPMGATLTLEDALPIVVQKSQSTYLGLVRGLRQGLKAVELKAAIFCVIAEDCDAPRYVQVAKALCHQKRVPLLTAPSAKALGEWAGLFKDKAKKSVGCSFVAVQNADEPGEALNVVMHEVNNLRSKFPDDPPSLAC